MIFVAIIAIAVVNGLPFSPYFDPMLFWIGRIVGRAYQASPVVFHGTTVVLTVLTLLVAAIPALLGRLIMGHQRIIPLLIWLVVAIAASWPALRIAIGFEE